MCGVMSVIVLVWVFVYYGYRVISRYITIQGILLFWGVSIFWVYWYVGYITVMGVALCCLFCLGIMLYWVDWVCRYRVFFSGYSVIVGIVLIWVKLYVGYHTVWLWCYVGCIVMLGPQYSGCSVILGITVCCGYKQMLSIRCIGL